MKCADMIAGVLGLLVWIGAAGAADTAATFNVHDFGAVGDGTTKDTIAFQKALDMCAVSGGGEVIVPTGQYLIGSVQIGTRTIIRLQKDALITGSSDLADYPMIDIRWEGRWQPGHRALIYSANVDHTGIVGPGRIEGNPAVAAGQNPRGSVVIEAISCNDLRWEDFTVTQGGNWATHPTYCANVVIKNLNISGGRDGIDVDSCKDVRIEGCEINTGDDCISLKSGRGLDGACIGRPCEDVVITNCKMTDRTFACIGIGSETSAGVRDVRIEHCTMSAPRSPNIYIKTRIGRAGFNENIVGEDLEILAGSFLRVNLVSGGNTNTADDPVEGLIGYPTAKDIRFTNVRLTNAPSIAEVTLVAPQRPIEGLKLENIKGTATKGITMQHVRNAVLGDINVTGVTGPMLAVDDVTGTGLDDAVKYVAPPPSTAPALGRRGARGAAAPATRPGR